MDSKFWLQRWREGHTGWHRDGVMPWLQKHWPALAMASGSRVLVPLCGKSVDMLWLAGQGHHVLGIELSPLAIGQFFDDNDLQAQVASDESDAQHYAAGDLEIINTDVFDVLADTLASCSAIYDRAALIALPPDLRQRYASHVYGSLRAGSRGLLITLEYPQDEMSGPPFSVEEAEVRRLFGAQWNIDQLERRDVLSTEPRFAAAGVTRLHTCVYLLQCKLSGS